MKCVKFGGWLLNQMALVYVCLLMRIMFLKNQLLKSFNLSGLLLLYVSFHPISFQIMMNWNDSSSFKIIIKHKSSEFEHFMAMLA